MIRSVACGRERASVATPVRATLALSRPRATLALPQRSTLALFRLGAMLSLSRQLVTLAILLPGGYASSFPPAERALKSLLGTAAWKPKV